MRTNEGLKMLKMSRQISLVCLAVTISSCQTRGAGECSYADNDEIVYHAKGTGVVNRFEMADLWHSTEGLDYLNCEKKPTNHFGGNIRLISSDDYVGMSSPYTIVVPRVALGRSRWAANGISCLADDPVTKGNKVSVSCARTEGSSTSFIYDPIVGVTEYVYSRNPDLRFQLAGERGLFPTVEE